LVRNARVVGSTSGPRGVISDLGILSHAPKINPSPMQAEHRINAGRLDRVVCVISAV
jgi:hypothetical protein